MSDVTPDLIYVVDHLKDIEVDLKSAQTVLVDDSAGWKSMGWLGVAVLGSFMPVALVAAAAAKPLVAKLFDKDSEQKPEDIKHGLTQLGETLKRHALAVDRAKSEFEFPPGHPAVGLAYRRHPLSTKLGPGGRPIYIPADQYDEILLEEREAELLMLLVDLGATKVSIIKQNSMSSTMKIEASAAGTGLHGEAHIGAHSDTKSANQSADTRDFELQGRDLVQGDDFDESKFSWVRFEPSWAALIRARTIGFCTKAALEVRERSTYSADRGLDAAIKAKVVNVNVAAKTTNEDEREKVYLVRVEFKPMR